MDVYRLWILAESRIHLKDFELTENELNEIWSDRVKEHKELEEKVRCSSHTTVTRFLELRKIFVRFLLSLV